jgi:hypothetical protein
MAKRFVARWLVACLLVASVLEIAEISSLMAYRILSGDELSTTWGGGNGLHCCNLACQNTCELYNINVPPFPPIVSCYQCKGNPVLRCAKGVADDYCRVVVDPNKPCGIVNRIDPLPDRSCPADCNILVANSSCGPKKPSRACCVPTGTPDCPAGTL